MNTDIVNTALPQMTVKEIVRELAASYCSLIANGVAFREYPSVMLWGPPGVGKSQAVRQLAKRITEETGKQVNITDVRLLLFNPIDLRGIPTANADKTLAVWLRPQIFNMDPDDGVVNILFLDEISAAPQSVQAAAYQITLDRVVGEHRLPENCIVIAAGNRTTDKAVAYKMPKPLANRMLHFEVQKNSDSWLEWAVQSGINEKVLGFLSFRPDMLMNFEPGSEDLAFATPRSWEMVSNILNHISPDVEKVYHQIAGLIGTGTAIEFRNWATVYSKLPDIEAIFDGRPTKETVKELDVLHALCAAMTTYAREHKDDAKNKNGQNGMDRIFNSIKYAGRNFPSDFQTMLIKDYMYLDPDFKQKLMIRPEFIKWISTEGSRMNGYFRDTAH